MAGFQLNSGASDSEDWYADETSPPNLEPRTSAKAKPASSSSGHPSTSAKKDGDAKVAAAMDAVRSVTLASEAATRLAMTS